MTECFRCHVDNEEYRFRILNVVYCYKCYMYLLDKIKVLLESERVITK